MATILGITGGIGSGKSYVCHLLEKHFQIPIYYSDDEAKRLNVTDKVIRKELTRLVGPDVYLGNGELNKPVLANYLFASETHAKQVNAIIHPRVKADFKKWVKKQKTDIVAMECAILFESGFDVLVDKVITVTAPEDVRIERIIQRDHTTEEKARERMNLQTSDEERLLHSDYHIVNDGHTDIVQQLQAVLSFFRNNAL